MLILKPEKLDNHLIRYYSTFRSVDRFSNIRLYDIHAEDLVVPYTQEYLYNPTLGKVPPIKTTIVALCSTIHLPTNAAIAFAKSQLRKYSNNQINIEIQYYKNSGEIINLLKLYNACNIPVIATFSEGSSKKVQAGYHAYQCKRAIECTPGYLRFTNPNYVLGNDKKQLNNITLLRYDHPSDKEATAEFIREIGTSNLIANPGNQIVVYKEMPEIPDQYQTLKKDQVSLTAEFLDTIQHSKSSVPSLFDWHHKERRYLHFNDALIKSLYSIKGFSGLFLAKWFQRYLVNIMRKIATGNLSFWQHIIADKNYDYSLKTYFK